jgi:23S rRNA (cytosine1962-C5)-methyltransferase
VNSTFQNRLAKKWRLLEPWAHKEKLTAFRVYDRDTPEYPLAVDRYGPYVHVSEFPTRRARREGTEAVRTEVLSALEAVMGISAQKVLWKTHVPQAPGGDSFRPLRPRVETVVEENGLRFEVNLTDFYDTGLFLDHRNTRARIRDESKDARFLNLFAYTGSFSVYAAAGGARQTVTVDLSQTYLDWAQRNLALNSLDQPAHQRVRADVLEWLEAATHRPERFDRIVLDPPSFSRSRNMRGSLEIQRDHVRLVEQTMQLLAPGGVLYFSTNLKDFQPELPAELCAQELTPRSLPRDFERKDSHRCWRIAA